MKKLPPIAHPDQQALVGLNLGEQAYALIRREIVSCSLPPGISLTEQQIRDRYGLTVASTRAALGRLTQDGLVQAEPRRGYLVAALTLRDVVEVFDTRRVIEAGAARLATLALTPMTLAAIEDSLNARHQQTDHGPAFVDANRAFHVAVARATGNARIVKIIERLLDDSERVLRMGLVRFDESDRYDDEHRAVVDLMRHGRGEEAERLTSQHIEDGKQVVLDAIRAGPQFLDMELMPYRSSVNGT